MYGKFLKQFTLETGIQQKQVASKLNYSPQRVGNYYRDISDPPFEFLEGFKKEFEIDLKTLKEKEDKGVNVAIGTYKRIPVFNLDLNRSGKPDFFNISELIIYDMEVPCFNDCSHAIIVSGQDMIPTYNPADVVAIKRITDLEVIPYGGTFLVITNEQTLLRYIYEGDKQTVVLKAENGKFGNMTISISKIKYLFQVKGKITRF